MFTNNPLALNNIMLFGGYGKDGLRNDIFSAEPLLSAGSADWTEVVQPGCNVDPPEPGPEPVPPAPPKGNSSNSTNGTPPYDIAGDIGLAFVVIIIVGLAAGAVYIMFRRYNLLGFGGGDGSRQSMLSHDSENSPVATKDSYGTNLNMNPHPESWN